MLREDDVLMFLLIAPSTSVPNKKLLDCQMHYKSYVTLSMFSKIYLVTFCADLFHTDALKTLFQYNTVLNKKSPDKDIDKCFCLQKVK
jgi:hypothetical protein